MCGKALREAPRSELAGEDALQDVTEADVHAAVLRFCIHLGRSAASAETRRR